MNVGSLFSGAGLMDWGLTLAGFEHRWFCERDAYCRHVLNLRYPGVPVYEDVRDIDASAERVNLISGGFPCQPVSLVGRRQAQSDDRWLWPEFLRVVRLLRPRYVLVENVPGLLTAGMGDVLGGLASSGYDAEWDCLPASAFGAPHIRDRIFLLAYPGGSRRRQDAGGAPSDEGKDARGAAQDHHKPDGNGEGDRSGDVAHADGQRLQEQRRTVTAPTSWERPERARRWPIEPDVGRMAHGVPHRVDRLRALGNGVVPQVAEYVGRRILERDEQLSVLRPGRTVRSMSGSDV